MDIELGTRAGESSDHHCHPARATRIRAVQAHHEIQQWSKPAKLGTQNRTTRADYEDSRHPAYRISRNSRHTPEQKISLSGLRTTAFRLHDVEGGLPVRRIQPATQFLEYPRIKRSDPYLRRNRRIWTGRETTRAATVVSNPLNAELLGMNLLWLLPEREVDTHPQSSFRADITDSAFGSNSMCPGMSR